MRSNRVGNDGHSDHAEPAALTQVVDPGQLGAQVLLVEVVRVLGVVGDRQFQLTAPRPWLKRPAWLFSALAKVSNHSAMESKPSSRAVLEKPGYISLYS